jgi:hypothetical protein
LTSRTWNENWSTGVAPPGDSAANRSLDRYMPRYLFTAILLCLAYQAVFVFVQRGNWDEYYYLALIYDFQRGELTKAPQTFHVYPFFWLPRISGNELWQVEVGRLCMLAMFSGTCLLTYATARAFASRLASAFAVLVLVSLPDIIIHAASFRADPMAAFLTMTCVAILARSKLDTRWLIVAGGSLVLALLVTIKIALFAPTLAALALWRWADSTDRPALAKRFAVSAVVSVFAFGILFFIHQQAIGIEQVATSKRMIESAAQTTLADHDTLALKFLFRQSLTSSVQIIFLLLASGTAIWIALRARAIKNERFRALLLLAIASPIVSIFFYRNAFPYFYPFILPPAMILVAWWVDRVGFGARLVAFLAAIMLVGGASAAWMQYYRSQDMQQQVVHAVHEIFPEPVHYIDRNSMIASFPKRGIFMSTWGLTSYAEAGQPIYEPILAKDIVPLLLLNSQALKEAVGDDLTNEPIVTLLEPDRQILRDNYIPHSGPIWLAGKQLNLGPTEQRLNFAVPGGYTVEARSGILFDGKPLPPGAFVQISRGAHLLRSEQAQQVTLRWGNGLARPIIKPTQHGLYGKM